MGLYTFLVSTDANGAGTVTSNHQIRGLVREVRYGRTALSGTATYTIKRVVDGATILAYTATSNPWARAPCEAAHLNTTGGTTAYNTGVGPVLVPVPVSGAVKLVIANGGSVLSNEAVHLYVCDY
jgi:hypothetical protein